jgi:hypothetical protein
VYYRENVRYSNSTERMYGTVTVQRECTVQQRGVKSKRKTAPFLLFLTFFSTVTVQ